MVNEHIEMVVWLKDTGMNSGLVSIQADIERAIVEPARRQGIEMVLSLKCKKNTSYKGNHTI